MMRTVAIAVLVLSAGAGFAQVQDPPQWNPMDSFVAGGLVRGSDGNYYRCLHTTTGSNPVGDDHTNWELYYVRANTTLNVAMSGARFSSLRRAWDMVSSATIAAPVQVAIFIDGSKTPYQESFANPFSLNATSGSQITVQGSSSAQVTLTFSSSGFFVSSGHTFGGLRSVTLQQAGNTPIGLGVGANASSSILDLSSVNISGFNLGVQSSNHSSITGNSVTVTGFRLAGLSCNVMASLLIDNCVITGASSSLGKGVVAEFNSMVLCTSSKSSNCFEGFHAETGALISAEDCEAFNCGEDGFVVLTFGCIQAPASSAHNNAGHGFACAGTGRIVATGATVSANAAGDFSPVPNKMDANGNYIQH